MLQKSRPGGGRDGPKQPTLPAQPPRVRARKKKTTSKRAPVDLCVCLRVCRPTKMRNKRRRRIRQFYTRRQTPSWAGRAVRVCVVVLGRARAATHNLGARAKPASSSPQPPPPGGQSGPPQAGSCVRVRVCCVRGAPNARREWRVMGNALGAFESCAAGAAQLAPCALSPHLSVRPLPLKHCVVCVRAVHGRVSKSTAAEQ